MCRGQYKVSRHLLRGNKKRYRQAFDARICTTPSRVRSPLVPLKRPASKPLTYGHFQHRRRIFPSKVLERRRRIIRPAHRSSVRPEFHRVQDSNAQFLLLVLASVQVSLAAFRERAIGKFNDGEAFVFPGSLVHRDDRVDAVPDFLREEAEHAAFGRVVGEVLDAHAVRRRLEERGDGPREERR